MVRFKNNTKTSLSIVIQIIYNGLGQAVLLNRPAILNNVYSSFIYYATNVSI